MTFYSAFIKTAFDTISDSWMKYKQNHGATDVIRGWLGMESKIKDAPDAKPLPPVQGEILFKEVTFDYASDVKEEDGENEKGAPVLENFTLGIVPGETVAFVGESGSGKSTVLRLLQRLWEPQKGKITIDGHDITKVTMDSLNKQISVVPQDTKLFDNSLCASPMFLPKLCIDNQQPKLTCVLPLHV